MTGRDFLAVAQRLLTEPDEASWRTAVSRAYYAAFHAGREFFVGIRFQVPHSERAHAYLWLRLQNCKDGLLKTAGSDLHDLREKRNKADYDFRLPLAQNLAADLTRVAGRIILALEAAAADPARAAAAQAEMIVYERDVLQDVTYQP